jgi:hypothetical protein
MAADLIAVFSDILRQQIEPTIQDQIDWQDVLLMDLQNTPGLNREGVKRNFTNNSFEIASKTAGMTAHSGSENGALVTTSLGFDKMLVVPKFTRARSLVNHPTIVAVSGDASSLSSAATEYGIEIRKAMQRAAGRHIRGDGRGIVGVLAAGVVNSATHTIRAKTAGTVASNAKYKFGSQPFMEGQILEIGTETQFAAGTQTEGTVLSVNSDTSITFTAALALGSAAGANNEQGTNVDTWYIRFKGDYGTTPMGLFGLIDDGTISGTAGGSTVTTIQNVTRSTTPYMKSVVMDKTNASTIIADFRNLFLQVNRYNYGGMKYFLVSEDVYAKYTDSVTVTNQSNPGEAQYKSKLGTGHTGLQFAYGQAPIPILYDSLLPYGTVFLMDTDQLFRADLFQDGFIPGGLMNLVNNTTNYETIRASYYNYGTFSSRKLGGQINYQSV